MTTANGPYALPHALEHGLARVHAFRERHEAEMPFWDDVKISATPAAMHASCCHSGAAAASACCWSLVGSRSIDDFIGARTIFFGKL